MVEEAGIYFKSLDVTNADGIAGGREMEGDDFRVLEWMDGLPSSEDLIPLTQLLVSPDLASAFRIPRPDLQTILDLHQATQNTISNLLGHQNQRSENSLKHFSSAYAQNTAICDPNDPKEYNTSQKFASDQADGSSTATETAVLEEEDSPSIRADSSVDENSGRMLKRPRIVWTPQLHKRFVDAVAHLGIKNAVPKTIMQLMNVDGLTRENVASHLQKYRLYLKRSHVFSDEGPQSSSDHPFASTSLLPRLHEQQMPVPLPPYALSTMIPMPIYNMPHRHSVGLLPVSNHQGKPFV